MEPIAVLELDRELGIEVACFQPAGPVFDIGQRRGPREAPHERDRARTGAEPELAETAPDVAAPHESHLRVEVVADDEPLDLHAVAIARIVQLRAIAGR